MRNPVFDIMKGIGIIAVIFGHIPFPETLIPVRTFIFSWHMPLFFVISGYFYYSKTITNTFKSSFRSLIVPYFVTAFFMFLAASTYHIVGIKYGYANPFWGIIVGAGTGNLPNYGQYFVGAIWFLQALFWCKFIYNLIYLTARGKKTTIAIFVLLLSCVATYVAKHIYIPTNFLQGISAMIFYLFGNLCKTIKYQLSSINYQVLMCIIAASILVSSNIAGPMYMVECYYSSYLFNVVGGICGCYLVYLLAKSIKSSRIGLLLTQIGNISILVLCVHIVDLNSIKYIRSFIDYKFLHTEGILSNLFILSWNMLFAIVGALILSKITIVKKIFLLKN